MPCTVYACALALERNPEAAAAMVEAGWEVATHGYRWWDYQHVDEDTEREHIRKVKIWGREYSVEWFGSRRGNSESERVRMVNVWGLTVRTRNPES
jgi:peptidoglycan/xylan/chitin deacetylase (PgdA/CDA1 family)